MKHRKLGQQGLEVPLIGLGCMGMSWAYGGADEASSLAVLDRAFELGINFWDTAELYGPFKNEELIGKALQGKQRSDIILATKFGWRFGPAGEQLGLDSSPRHIQEALEGSLKRLNTDYVDLYYQHRLDPAVPIEETVGMLSLLVDQGKVRYIGLSEVGPGTIRRAHAVHPLSAVQTEYSLWERTVEDRILPAMRKLGIGLVSYSPVGRGFLAGKFKRYEDIEETDWRRSNPRFYKQNFEQNAKLLEIVKKIASDNAVTASQVALAWLLRQGEDIVPIPGTTRIDHLEENIRAGNIPIPDHAWAALDTELVSFTPAGNRYANAGMQIIDRTE
ncbi:MAG: aldo/keto reductase [Nitrospirota bacterium]